MANTDHAMGNHPWDNNNKGKGKYHNENMRGKMKKQQLKTTLSKKNRK